MLKHTSYNYNRYSQVTEEIFFDANNQYQHKIKYQYDEKGRLHKTVNPVGETITYGYDQNNNKTYEKLEGVEAHTTFEYDKANRLTQVNEYHYNDSNFHTSFEYDLMGNKVAACDRYGQTTHYDYDSFNRVKKITFPDGSTIHKEYDIFDNVISETNQNGAITAYEYTIRNAPCRIKHPDGTEERFEYNSNGTLAHKWDRGGIKTSYDYDLLGRVIKTAIYDANSTLLSCSTSTYNAFHLLSTTDPMGHTTFFRYDNAGRKIEEWQETSDNYSKTAYEYDTLGRLCCTKRYYGKKISDFIATHIQYDKLNRVMVEKQKDASGTCTSWTYYEYDALGNCTLKRTGHLEGDDAEVQCHYNSKGELIKQTDECGNATTVQRNHSFINRSGAKTVQKITTDALNNSCEEYYDILGRLKSIVRKNGQGKLCASTKFFYNGTGQKTKQVERVVINGKIDHDYIITWEYDLLDRITKLTEQPNTPDEKVTCYTYDASGRIATLTKPDGVILTHVYDGLGRLTHLSSSDGTVSYAYSYDLNNNPIEVIDEVSKHTSLYSYDRWNRTLSDGLQSYTYDCFGSATYHCNPRQVIGNVYLR